jgi:hypothetical protein
MKNVLYIIPLLILFAFSACEMTLERSDSPVLAKVGSQALTLEDALNEIPDAALQQDSVSALHAYTDQWIQSALAVREAEKLGIHNNRQVRDKLERLRRQVLEESLKEFILNRNLDELEVSREEAQTYYQTYRDQFTLDERFVRYRHITTQTRTEADNANRDLARGIEWRQILDNYSVNPDLQYRQSQQFWPVSMAGGDNTQVSRMLSRIGITERSPIFIHDGQFHLVQLMEDRPAGEHPDLEWLIPQIQEWLKLEKARRITNSFMRNLYLEANANNEIERATVTDIQSALSNVQ